jgi:hypothetical protein
VGEEKDQTACGAFDVSHRDSVIFPFVDFARGDDDPLSAKFATDKPVDYHCRITDRLR